LSINFWIGEKFRSDLAPGTGPVSLQPEGAGAEGLSPPQARDLLLEDEGGAVKVGAGERALERRWMDPRQRRTRRAASHPVASDRAATYIHPYARTNELPPRPGIPRTRIGDSRELP
jgi:hypothetical protein